MKKVIIYTDGAASGNPGQGGYGVLLRYGALEKEISQGYKFTTNNRMELLAVIKGLECLTEACEVTVYSDSKYVVDAIEKKWVFGWLKKGFKNKKNPDLWKRFLECYSKHKVNLIWVKGHSSIPENERCDRLAVKASQSSDLIEDKWYIENEKKQV